ncbi:MAG: peptide ABC transporter substrate-binding protein [Parachlamydiales bacterium]|nr:peptide ABC transporter substrate-binding protein [Parachlamydiales bacterium]
MSFKFKQRFFLSIALFLQASLITSCGVSNSNEQEKKQILTLNLFTEPPSLDPRQVSDLTSAVMVGAIFEGLTRMDSNSQPQLALAESINISQDGLTYTIKLRPSTWSDGTPVTAKDFAYTWTSTLDPKFLSTYAYQLYPIKNAKQAKEGKVKLEEVGVKALDDLTLIVTLNNPTPYFTSLLATPTYFPINQKMDLKNKQWADNSGPDYICNGPFNMINWRHNDEIIVTKNTKYWDASSVKLNQITLVIVGDNTTELNMFQDHELDWAGEPFSQLPSEAFAYLKKEKIINTYPVSGDMWLEFNVTTAPFNNEKLRLAFAYAVNRQIIVDNILQGGEQPAFGIVPPTMNVDFTPTFKDHDTELAKTLFAQALDEMKISKDQLPAISYTYNSNSLNQLIAQAVQEQWFQTFGVLVTLKALDWKVYLQQLGQKQFQIARMGWVADYDDPMSFLEIFETTAADGNNFTGWHNPQYQDMLEKARSTTDVVERKKLQSQAQTLLMKEMPIIPLYFVNFSYLKNPALQGVVLTTMGIADFKKAYFEFNE